jgi:hypothetical protein
MSITDKALAVLGFTSYRYAGRYGWVMIGAWNIEGALKEAKRSTGENCNIHGLQVWCSGQYISAK